MTSTETPVLGMTTLPSTGANRPHGYARYKLDGCRCYTCGFAHSQYLAARARAIAYGTWQPFVDARPVREHLQQLRNAGMGLRRIAELSGVDRRRLQSVLTGLHHRGTGPQEKIRPANAEAVLRVEATLDTIGPSTPVLSVGTQRRVQALVAIGWPQAHLATRLGMTGTNFSRAIHSERVMARTALSVRALYAELWNQDPRQHGVGKGAYARSKNTAVAAGWVPPAAWDDDEIDLPDATPATSEQPLNFHERAELRATEILHLASYGATPEEIATRLGLGRDYVVSRLRELREVAA